VKICPLCDTTYPSHNTNCEKDGALLIERQELEPGTIIRGKYRIVRLLGRGGMGTVYLAEHILLGRQRALKFISNELSQDPRFLKRFRHEAQAAIELRHANLVEVVDLDQAEDGSPYIAMEYIEGPDLRHALAGGAFSVERALIITRGVALGLSAAHAKGIIHRDVKPENILLDSRDGKPETPKLLDFGIAAMKETATAISSTRALMLTPQYASPEQWKGMDAKELDGRVDLYALGGVLYEMLTGQTNFHAHNNEGWMYQHLQSEPKAPSRLRPELANWPGLDALLLQLLAKDREQRPKNAAELVRALDALGSVALEDRKKTLKEQILPDANQKSVTKGLKSSSRWGIWFGLLTGGLLLALLAMWFISQRPNQQANKTVQTPPIVQHQQDNPLPEQISTLKPTNPNSNKPLQPNSTQVTHPLVNNVPSVPNVVPSQPKPSQVEPATPSVPQPSMAEIDKQARVLFDQKRYGEAAPLYDQACSGGLGRACNWLGLMYQHGDGVVKDNSHADTLYAKGCAVGEANACENIGFMYTVGNGVPLDYSQAAIFFSKACEEGLAIGCANLGYTYENGRGVARDASHAATLYAKACDTGEPMGCTNLAFLYAGGNGVPKNDSRAAALFSKSCDVGYALGCSNLGNFYADGIGVTKDSSRAVALFSKACDGGISRGCANLGLMYDNGNGVAQDYSRAATLYSKACEMGEGAGCRSLGNLYLKGNGVGKDVERARQLLNKSCTMKDPVGCALLKTVP
jgi:TPR repeat protein/tRNA A-37 threonylcarbamoyl transferase component Bud32